MMPVITLKECPHMTQQTRKADRLIEVERLLRGRPSGYTVRQLAEKLGVSMRTMQRTMTDLDLDHQVPIEFQGRYYKISPGMGQPLAPVRFTLQEGRALYIAGRLFLRHADERDPDAISAMDKLAETLPEPIAVQVRQTVQELTQRPNDRNESEALRSLTEAWAHSKTVVITYSSQSAGKDRTTPLDPYFLEPSATGAATYVTGYSHEHGEMRTFKIDRIRGVEYTGQTFTADTQKRDEAMAKLGDSWGGVVMGDDQFDIVLDFGPEVASRVSETNWHRSQSLTPLPNGGVRFELRLPSLMEFVPWVRSWGPAVKVVGPEELRSQIADSLRQAAAMYGEE